MDYEASASTAFNPSSTFLPGGEYEVFLSFRGPDTRYTFTDFLYTNLEGAGVYTFLDDNELRKGEDIGSELLKAIMESRISIPIFSKNYASSKWCLRELVKMVECKRTSSQLILPIFYDVEPFEVRHQSGSYEEAFRKHEICFDESTVKEWKEALREVGALKGWEVKKEADGHQGKLVKMVVQTVLLELKKNYMVLTNNLVGIDDHVNEMKRLLKVDSNDTRIVGIYGMGGIGKTTIAKFIYNELVKCFECCSFLADIRETTQQQKGLVSLQKQLLADSSTLKSCPDIVDINSGIAIIKQRFLRRKVLIVLDDLNEKSHFDWLVGSCDFFGPGSRIIVTTRDKHVLDALQVEAKYEPPFMNSEQSLQLFSMHAFRSKLPQNGYNDISRMIASTAAGLPLALEVIGSFLFHKQKKVWENTLKKLKKIPDDQVQKKLRISYDELNYEQQQIFLDIAYFFTGRDKTYVFYMWDDCGYYPEKELNVLCLMSLVKLGDDNELKMHDQLRDLGREIVRQEDPRNPGARSRLWDQEEALQVLKECRGTEKVEVLELDLMKMEMPVTCKEFTKLFNLRYLNIYSGKLVGDFKHYMSELRWLRWYDCPRRFKATHFHTENLVILELYISSITEDWKGWSQIKMANKLKVLDLRHLFDLRRTPDFSPHPSLEILIFKSCAKLVKIDRSIGNLKSLRVLDISGTKIRRFPDEVWMLEKLEVIDAKHCYELKGNIPGGIGRLSSLRQLTFSGTKIQSIPTSICNLSCLQTLDMVYSRELEALPDLPSSLEILKVHFGPKNLRVTVTPNIANLVNLQELEFRYLRGDVEFPRHIEKLSKLQVLTLCRTDTRILPKGIGALSRLKILTVESCHDLQCILGLPSSLVQLCLDSCESLERLPDLSNLKILLELRIEDCVKLMEIQGLGELESLKSLDIARCHTLASLRIAMREMLKEDQGLEFLESPTISMHTTMRHEIAELDPLSASLPLETLEVSHCTNLNKIQQIGALSQLKILTVSSCDNLQCILGLPSSLVEISLNSCESLERLPDLSNLKNLLKLEIFYCVKLMEIQGLGELESLTSLDIAGCHTLEEVKIVGKLKSLASLRINTCEMLKKVQGLQNLESLTVLSISSCHEIAELDLLSASLPIEKFEVSSCTNLNKIPGLDRLVSLTSLNLTGCTNLQNIQGLDRLVSVEYLDLSFCTSIVSLPNLSNMKMLRSLQLGNCTSIVSLPNLSNLKMLRSLQLEKCTSLREIEGLEALEALELLDIRECTSLERVPHLPNTNILQTLTRQNSGYGWKLCEIFRSWFSVT